MSSNLSLHRNCAHFCLKCAILALNPLFTPLKLLNELSLFVNKHLKYRIKCFLMVFILFSQFLYVLSLFWCSILHLYNSMKKGGLVEFPHLFSTAVFCFFNIRNHNYYLLLSIPIYSQLVLSSPIYSHFKHISFSFSLIFIPIWSHIIPNQFPSSPIYSQSSPIFSFLSSTNQFPSSPNMFWECPGTVPS